MLKGGLESTKAEKTANCLGKFSTLAFTDLLTHITDTLTVKEEVFRKFLRKNLLHAKLGLCIRNILTLTVSVLVCNLKGCLVMSSDRTGIIL